MTTKPLEVLDSLAPGYVLPPPPRAPGEVVVMPRRIGWASPSRGGEVARAIGDRMLALAEVQQQFLGEVRQRLIGLDAAIAEDSRAQLKGALREVLGVLDWCDVVQTDLQEDGQRAAGGAEPIDVAEFCRAVVTGLGPQGRDVQVVGWLPAAWWGEATALAEAVECGLALVAERVGGGGSRCLEVRGEVGSATIRIASTGNPVAGLDARLVRRFRQAAERIAARVLPDADGPGSAGLVLELPTPSI